MDIQVYEIIFNGLEEYNEEIGKPYDTAIVRYPSSKPTYPYCVFEEVSNLANRNYNTNFDRVATLGYKLEVYAKEKNKVSKQQIAREIAQKLNKFLTDKVGLRQISFTPVPQLNNSTIYQITITYSAQLHENRRKFI